MAALAAGLRLEEGERITLDVVDELLEVALEVVKDHKARAQVVPFLVDFVKQQALNALEMVFLRRDAGEPSFADDDSWRADTPATAPAMDSWARGVVPVKTAEAPGSDGQVTQRTATTRNTATTASTLRRAGTPGAVGGPVGRSPLALRKPAPLPAAPADADPDDLLRSQLERQKRMAETAKKERKTQEAVEAERVAKLAKELKGKDYTFDSDGNPIPLMPVDPRKLPPSRVGPRVSVGATRVESSSPPARGKPSARRSTPASSKSTSRRESAPAADHVPIPVGPSVAETMKLNPGVTLRDGTRVKEGGTRLEDQKRMTKNAYLESLRSMDLTMSFGASQDHSEPL